MVLEYFAYWNGAQIRDLFEAVVAITSGPSYQGLIKSAVLAGFLVTLTTALFRWQGMAAKTFLFASILFYSILLIPKTDLSIHDERAGTVHVVNNVPFGIGFFAATSSKIGHFLTESFESAFALPDAEKFSKFGMVYPQRAISVLQNIGTVTPEGRQKVNRFVADCLTPELIDYPDKVNELAHSSDIWATVTANGWLNPARNSLEQNGTVRSCPDAATDLDNYLQSSELDAVKKKLGTILVPDRIDPAQTIIRTLPHAETLLLGLTRSLDASLKHSIMIQAVPEGISTLAKQSASPLLLATNLSKAQANLAGEINYRAMSEIAKVALPKIRNCIEFVIIAAFPLVFILLIAAGSQAGIIFRSFFVLLIWVQLWAPLYAVTNYLLITVDSNPMNRIIAEYGGNSLMAVDLIRQTGASSQAMAGYLMIAIPMLALAIAKASDHAAVAMVGGLMASSQSAAQGTAGQLSAGNFSSGNVSSGNTSFNSTSANKNDVSSSLSDPYSSNMTTAYGSVTRDGESNVTGMARTGIDLGVTSLSTIQTARSNQVSSDSSTSLTRTDMANLSLNNSASYSSGSGLSFAKTLSNQIAKSHSTSENWSDQRAYNESNSVASSSTASSGLTTNQNIGLITGGAIKVGGAAGTSDTPVLSPEVFKEGVGHILDSTSRIGFAGTPPATASGTPPQGTAGSANQTSAPSPFKGVGSVAGEMAALEVGLKTTTAQNLIDTATGANTQASTKQRSQAYSTLKAAAEQIAATTNDANVKAAANNFSASLDKAYQASFQETSQHTTAKRVGSSRTSSEIGSETSSVNNDVMVMNTLLSRGHSPEASLENLFHRYSEKDSLGIKAAADAKHRADTGEYMGSGQFREPETTIGKNALQDHKSFSQAANQRVMHADEKNKEQMDSNDAPLSINPLSHAVATETQNRAARIDQEKSQGDEISKAEEKKITRGVENYQREEKGMNKLLSVSLAGGMGYTSPLDK